MKNITRNACFLMAVCLICCSLVSCSSGITTSGSTATSESAASDFTTLADYEKNTGALNFKSCRTTESQTPFGRENETVLRCLTPAKTLGTIPEQAAEKLEQACLSPVWWKNWAIPAIPTSSAASRYPMR